MPGEDWFFDLFGFKEIVNRGLVSSRDARNFDYKAVYLKTSSYAETKSWFRVVNNNINSEAGETRPSQVLVSLANGRRFNVGLFYTPRLDALRREVKRVPNRRELQQGRLKLQNVFGDVSAFMNHPDNRHATFQVASQFNCLEFTSPLHSPEMGVYRYVGDKTQGPACSIAAGPATVFRNYFVRMSKDLDGPQRGDLNNTTTNSQIWEEQSGQTHDHMINNLKDVSYALSSEISEKKNTTSSEYFDVQGGYSKSDDDRLAKLDAKLKAMDKKGEIDRVRKALRVGVHEDVEVTAENWGREINPGILSSSQSYTPHTVTQVFGSAIALGSYARGTETEAWTRFAKLVLQGSYEATLAAAVLTANRHRNSDAGARKVFLTLLGGGAFGNRAHWIYDAIRKACFKYRHWDLDVRVVSFREEDITEELEEIAKEFSDESEGGVYGSNSGGEGEEEEEFEYEENDEEFEGNGTRKFKELRLRTRKDGLNSSNSSALDVNLDPEEDGDLLESEEEIAEYQLSQREKVDSVFSVRPVDSKKSLPLTRLSTAVLDTADLVHTRWMTIDPAEKNTTTSSHESRFKDSILWPVFEAIGRTNTQEESPADRDDFLVFSFDSGPDSSPASPSRRDIRYVCFVDRDGMIKEDLVLPRVRFKDRSDATTAVGRAAMLEMREFGAFTIPVLMATSLEFPKEESKMKESDHKKLLEIMKKKGSEKKGAGKGSEDGKSGKTADSPAASQSDGAADSGPGSDASGGPKAEEAAAKKKDSDDDEDDAETARKGARSKAKQDKKKDSNDLTGESSLKGSDDKTMEMGIAAGVTILVVFGLVFCCLKGSSGSGKTSDSDSNSDSSDSSSSSSDSGSRTSVGEKDLSPRDSKKPTSGPGSGLNLGSNMNNKTSVTAANFNDGNKETQSQAQRPDSEAAGDGTKAEGGEGGEEKQWNDWNGGGNDWNGGGNDWNAGGEGENAGEEGENELLKEGEWNDWQEGEEGVKEEEGGGI